MTNAYPRCTAPRRRGSSVLCGASFVGYTPEGEPRCGRHVPGRKYSTRTREPDVVDVDLRCECGAYDTRQLAGDELVRVALARVTCQRCGALGKMHLAPAPPLEPPELPPHPEEP